MTRTKPARTLLRVALPLALFGGLALASGTTSGGTDEGSPPGAAWSCADNQTHPVTNRAVADATYRIHVVEDEDGVICRLYDQEGVIVEDIFVKQGTNTDVGVPKGYRLDIIDLDSSRSGNGEAASGTYQKV